MSRNTYHLRPEILTIVPVSITRVHNYMYYPQYLALGVSTTTQGSQYLPFQVSLLPRVCICHQRSVRLQYPRVPATGSQSYCPESQFLPIGISTTTQGLRVSTNTHSSSICHLRSALLPSHRICHLRSVQYYFYTRSKCTHLDVSTTTQSPKVSTIKSPSICHLRSVLLPGVPESPTRQVYYYTGSQCMPLEVSTHGLEVRPVTRGQCYYTGSQYLPLTVL